jgi:glycosyltransferase involved in cell wall biosynthesis
LIIILTSDICHKISGGTVYNTKLVEFLKTKHQQVAIEVAEDINSYDFDHDATYIIDSILIHEKLNVNSLKRYKVCFLIHLWPSLNKLGVNKNRLLTVEKLICEAFVFFVTGSVSLDYIDDVIQPVAAKKYLVEPGIDNGWNTKVHFEQHPIKIVYLANFIEGKGHIKLLEVLKRLKHLNFKVDCYGEILSEPYFLKLLSVTKRYSLHNIAFKDTIPHEHINGLLLEYDLMLHFSDYESFGMGVMEALCAHLPCIITPTGNYKQYQSIGIQGVLDSFDVDEMTAVVEYVLNSSARYLQLVESVKRIDIQSWGTNFELLLSKIENL